MLIEIEELEKLLDEEFSPLEPMLTGFRLLPSDLDENQHPWWGEGKRPENIILIANSDPYAILMNMDTGEVMVFLHEQDWKESIKVALDFSLYLRGLGTVFFMRQNKIPPLKIDFLNKNIFYLELGSFPPKGSLRFSIKSPLYIENMKRERI